MKLNEKNWYDNLPPILKLSTYGSYNRGVYQCPNCPWGEPGEAFKCIKGFARAPHGIVAVYECPECFKIWNCHATEDTRDFVLDTIEDESNFHFKMDKGEIKKV